MRAAVVAGAILVVAAATLAVSSEQASRGEIDYRLPLSDHEVVLEMVFTGGMERGSRLIQLFGDGQVLESTRRYGRETSTRKGTLSLEEMQGLMEVAIAGGLFEATQDELVNRSGVSLQDSGMTTLTLNLSAYSVNGDARGPQSVTLSLESPLRVAKYNNDSTAIAAYAKITERLLLVGAESP